MTNRDEYIIALREFKIKKKISDKAMIDYSGYVHELEKLGPLAILKKVQLKAKKDSWKRENIHLPWHPALKYFGKLEQITSENIDTIFLTEEEKGVIQKNKEVKAEYDEKNQEIVNKKLDTLKGQIRALSEIEIPKPTKFKALISEKEEEIISVGNDEKLFEFLKIDSFLNDFRNNIAANVNGIQEFLNSPDFRDVEYTITEAERRKRGDLTAEERKYNSSAEAISNKLLEQMEGKWESDEQKLAKFYGVGDMLQGTVESAVLTFNLYESYAISCVVFFLNKKRINYFEIHSAFEKLGVFDSTWEKSVKTKLEGIEARLDLINNQLVNLNAEFSNLIESNERTAELISEGLKEIKSSVDANTVVSAFTAYQMYKVNKNTKGLRE